MNEWRTYFSLLRCLHCHESLDFIETPKHFNQYSEITGELECMYCKKVYPCYQDIPVMFKNNNRTNILLDSATYRSHLKLTEDKMRRAAQVTSDALEQFKEENGLFDALTWEILFWEKWKHSDEGFLEFNRDKIEEYLQNDTEGGGRLNFFDRVLSFSDDNISGKRLLNIGAGRDFLLEKFLDEGCEVIEQDIVLDSLLFLKKRRASFCICTDARLLPFPDNVFHTATSFSVLHHIWPIEEPIKELLRVTSGNVHFNEPNCYALARAAVCLPNPVKRKLKQFHSPDYSHSPYERSINPNFFKRCVTNNLAEIKNLSYVKSSWLSGHGIKRVLRKINLFLLYILPFASSHFDAVIMKKKNNI